jgi:hypothetical protein
MNSQTLVIMTVEDPLLIRKISVGKLVLLVEFFVCILQTSFSEILKSSVT